LTVGLVGVRTALLTKKLAWFGGGVLMSSFETRRWPHNMFMLLSLIYFGFLPWVGCRPISLGLFSAQLLVTVRMFVGEVFWV